MKRQIFAFICFVCIFAANLYGETNGYFSFDYLKGQKNGASYGMFHHVKVGLIFSGELSTNVHYTVEIRGGQEFQFEIDQALLELNPSPKFQTKLGLYLVPFGKYNQSSLPHQTRLINLPLSVEFMYPYRWRDIGILMQGRFQSFAYSLYLGNGLSESHQLDQGQQFRDNNANKGKGGRVSLKLSQGLEIGYSHYRGKYDAENTRNMMLHCLDLTWDSSGFQILTELSRARMENPEDYAQGQAQGYFVQASFAWGSFYPVASFQRIDYEDPYHGSGFVDPGPPGSGISKEKNRWCLGVVYFIQKNILLKLEYDWNKIKGNQEDNHSLKLQMALSF